MVQAVLDSKFDVQKALDLVLSQGSKQNVKTKDEDAVIVRKTTKGKETYFVFQNYLLIKTASLVQ